MSQGHEFFSVIRDVISYHQKKDKTTTDFSYLQFTYRLIYDMVKWEWVAQMKLAMNWNGKLKQLSKW